MRLAPEIGTRIVVKGDNETIPRSEVLVDGRPTGTILNGEVFEAAVRIGDRTLIFLTDDVPFEEGLNIALLDAGHRLLDSAAMSVMYGTGLFSDLNFEPPDSVRFRFFGSEECRLRVLPAPRLRWPFLSEPAGVSRKFGFSRHMVFDYVSPPQAD